MTKTHHLILSASLFLAATSTPDTKAQGLFREDKAGSTHVAVISVIPWDEYVADLQPSYDFNEAKALEEVEKARRSMESMSINAIANRFDLAPPTSTTSSSLSQTIDQYSTNSTADGQTTETSGNTVTSTETSGREEGPGDVGTTPTGTSISSQATTPQLPEEAPEVAGIDPMLKYQTATALFQEVKLLNKYVDRAVQRTGYRPFIVRMQVTVAPRARKLPYDVYTNISFFGDEIAEEYRSCYNNPGDSKCTQATPYYNIDERCANSKDCQKKVLGKTYREQINSYKSELANKLGESGLRQMENNPEFISLALAENPIVIPLLVTDSIESTLSSQVTDRIRQFAFGLSFLIQGFGGKNEFQRHKRDLERILGRDFNSLMTVSRLSDNTYRVRLGAMQQVNEDYATIPRNHYITFLLLAPCPVKTISVAAQSQWTHATTGKILSPLPLRQVGKKIESIARDYVTANIINEADCKDFISVLKSNQSLVLKNLYGDFRRAISKSAPVTNKAKPHLFPYETLWNTLVSIMPLLNFSSTSFELRPPDSPLYDPSEILLIDDGTTSKTVIRGRGFVAGRVDAILNVSKAGKVTSRFPIPSESVTVSRRGSEALITYPSLEALDKEGKKFDRQKINVNVYCRGCSRNYCQKIEDTNISVSRTVHYIRKPTSKATKAPKEPGFEVETTSASIAAENSGQGTIQLALTMKTKKVPDPKGSKKKIDKNLCELVRIMLRGGDVVELVAKPENMISPHPSQYHFTDSGRIQLKLQNLNAADIFSISAKCEKGDGKGADKITLAVPVRMAVVENIIPVSVTKKE